MFEPVRGYVIDSNARVSYVNIPRPDGGGIVTQEPRGLRVPDVPYNPGPGPGPLPPSTPMDHLPHDATVEVRQLRAACPRIDRLIPLDLGPFEGFPLLIFGIVIAFFLLLFL